jgi:hypothetical protein
VRGRIRDLAFRGSGFTYQLDVPGLGEPLKAEIASGSAPELGSDVGVTWDPDACVLLPRDA